MFNLFKKKKRGLPTPKYKIGTKMLWFDDNTNIVRNVVVIDYVIEQDDTITYIVGSEDCEQIWEYIDEENLF